MSSAKLDALEDIIDTAISENKKLVIIARFIPEITEICNFTAGIRDAVTSIKNLKTHITNATGILKKFVGKEKLQGTA